MLYFWKGNGTRISKLMSPSVWHPNGDISLYLLGISPTLFASFPYQFASFSHQICFISPKKCVISPTKCCISPTNCFIYPTVRCISPCNFVSLCQFTKIRFYQVFSIFRCHSISKHLPLGWVSVWVGQWVEEKSLTNVSIVKSVENIWEFCEKLFPKPTFQICNVLTLFNPGGGRFAPTLTYSRIHAHVCIQTCWFFFTFPNF